MMYLNVPEKAELSNVITSQVLLCLLRIRREFSNTERHGAGGCWIVALDAFGVLRYTQRNNRQ